MEPIKVNFLFACFLASLSVGDELAAHNLKYEAEDEGAVFLFQTLVLLEGLKEIFGCIDESID